MFNFESWYPLKSVTVCNEIDIYLFFFTRLGLWTMRIIHKCNNPRRRHVEELTWWLRVHIWGTHCELQFEIGFADFLQHRRTNELVVYPFALQHERLVSTNLAGRNRNLEFSDGCDTSSCCGWKCKRGTQYYVLLWISHGCCSTLSTFCIPPWYYVEPIRGSLW